jgi:hypothetical protein
LATATQIEQTEHSIGGHAVGGDGTADNPALRLDPELRFLLACCSAEISSGQPQLDQILPAQLNWDRTLKLAEYHRLLPSLHAWVCKSGNVPLSIRSAIRARFQKHVTRVLRFSAELSQITRHFEDRGIEVLAHKGPALSQLLYDDPAMRQFGDLDFLVRDRDVRPARAALIELGYEPRLHLSPRQERVYLHSGYEFVFDLGAERNVVELQWQILPRFYATEFDMEALFQRSVDLQLDGLRLRMLGDEDQLLVLCVHAAKHQWAQIAMLRDIAVLARRQLDWQWVEAEAERLGIFRILAICLWLSRSLFQCELPGVAQTVADSIHAHAKGPASAIQARLIGGAELNPESFPYFRAMMAVRERWQDSVRFAYRLAVTPSVSEWQTIRLPDSLFGLYRGIRLLRWARRFSFPF